MLFGIGFVSFLSVVISLNHIEIADSRNLVCWKAEVWVDNHEKMISAQDGPHYGDGLVAWRKEDCFANQTQCYGVAVHITCPWVEYIQRKNGCYFQGYLEADKKEIERHLCENPRLAITQELCQTTLCNRRYTLTTTTTPAPEINATICNGTNCWQFNGTHWVSGFVPTPPGVRTTVGVGGGGGVTTGSGVIGEGGGVTGSGGAGKAEHTFLHKHHEHVHEQESSRSKKLKIGVGIGVGIVGIVGIGAFWCWWSFCWPWKKPGKGGGKNVNQNFNVSHAMKKYSSSTGWKAAIVDGEFNYDDPLLDERREK